ncbi:glycine--tRNA ligase subunit beta [Robiginitomaculum antarcticum]|uniref:glycine--tRNA ligase subunit beta n=1 Tax=Robiginitomaculum antarcticum TaxID=437507 RepID=UPI00037DC191|nr:glycine--tRNA ligase subunit beta [Robiginitomaculum antarcticum]
MAEFLLEIRSEEIPARMQKRAGSDLEKMITDGLKKAGLTVDGARSLYGPRRLTYVAEIPARSPDVSEERKGPRVGSPEQALAGFMRGAGLSDIAQAETRSDPKKGEFYVAIITSEGRNSADIIAELVPDVMGKFPWPKSMKSGSSAFRWVRPLSSITALLDGAVVLFTVGGVEAGNVTEGHRRMGKGPFTVTGYADYAAQLEGEGHVVLSAKQRKKIILNNAKSVCQAKGLELVEDEGLLDEVAGLVEYPVVILGDMDPSFLELPGEVIRLSMRTHQKYFAVREPKSGALAPNFVVVANQVAPDGGKAIAAGNSRVLSARLADAQFFQREDAKKELINYYDKLDTVVFHKKLGSIRDKADRVAALARELAPIVGAEADKAEQAAKLAKCDLVTHMVIEFTSLQGQIGRLMYEREGGDASIATAIEDHYKPQGPSDELPTDPVAIAVALADKLDTLVGFWAIDEKPTGSKDPFALRRAALGVVRIILKNKIRLNLTSKRKEGPGGYYTQLALGKLANQRIVQGAKDKDAIVISMFLEIFAWDDDPTDFEAWKAGSRDILDAPYQFLPSDNNLVGDLLAFILDRLKGVLRDQGMRHDVIDAVYSNGGDDLLDITNRVCALQSFINTDDGTNLLAGYKRAANILRAESKKDALPDMAAPIDVAKLPQDEDKNLHRALIAAKTQIDSALSEESYGTAMTALSSLRPPIDAFFDGVMVNHEDADIRANRLRLLGMIRDTARAIADFDAIDG